MRGRWAVKRMAGRLATVALFVLATGCASTWTRWPKSGLDEVNPRETIQVWQGRRVLELRALRITADSVSGVPFFKPASCDSCRIVVARSAIDSIRVGGSTNNGVFAGFLVGFGTFIGLLYLTFHGMRD